MNALLNEQGCKRAQYKPLRKTVNGGFDEKMRSNAKSERRRVGFSLPKRIESGKARLYAAITT
jgi:hypothetical protein